jgi:catechol 2,3-dioxygenase-like lactoylglutathione lyase family enzyme
MPRLDHAAFESEDPDRAAAFYESVLGPRIVRTEAITYTSGEGPRRS